MSYEYQIIRTSDLDDLLIDSWTIAYPDFKYRYPIRSNWLHKNNTFRGKLPESIIYVKENNVAVAWTSAIYHELLIVGKDVLASFGADTYTLDQARGKGYASLLQKMSTNDLSVWWGISLAPANRRIFLKIGFREGKPLSRYFKLLTKLSKPNFFESARLIGNTKKGIIKTLYRNKLFINIVYYISNLIHNHDINVNNSDIIKLQTFDVFDKVHESIFDSVKNDFDLIVSRSINYLNCRYNQAPYLKYKKLNII